MSRQRIERPLSAAVTPHRGAGSAVAPAEVTFGGTPDDARLALAGAENALAAALVRLAEARAVLGALLAGLHSAQTWKDDARAARLAPAILEARDAVRAEERLRDRRRWEVVLARAAVCAPELVN